MEITLMAAVSLDGFIARDDGKTDWVQDWELFESTCREFGCIVMGARTFAEFGKAPFKNVETIVLSTKKGKLHTRSVHYVDSVNAAIKQARALGSNKLLVIGGS